LKGASEARKRRSSKISMPENTLKRSTELKSTNTEIVTGLQELSID